MRRLLWALRGRLGLRPTYILTVCAGNTCRSPLLAALIAHDVKPDAVCESAGVMANTGSRAADAGITVGSGFGWNLSTHRSRHVADVPLWKYDRVIALSPSVADILRTRYKVPAGTLITLHVPDPFGGSVYQYLDAVTLMRHQIAGVDL